MKEKGRKVPSVRDKLLSMGKFKDVPIEENKSTNKPPCPDCGRTDAEYFNKKYWCMCGTFYWIEKARGEII